MRNPPAACLCLLLAQCAPQVDSPAAGAPAGARIECIDLSAVAARRAEGPDSIRFEMFGGKAFVNHLPGRCPGLAQSRDFGALAFEVQGNRLCHGDTVRALDPALGGYGQSVPCVLGSFTPAAPEPR
ncbi:MAG: hypothetical protein JWO25_1066 [Alphaproteobacteria bacterium]|nr:hypothetical protein [Alphaproteobacteria bacterium]